MHTKVTLGIMIDTTRKREEDPFNDQSQLMAQKIYYSNKTVRYNTKTEDYSNKKLAESHAPDFSYQGASLPNK